MEHITVCSAGGAATPGISPCRWGSFVCPVLDHDHGIPSACHGLRLEFITLFICLFILGFPTFFNVNFSNTQKSKK